MGLVKLTLPWRSMFLLTLSFSVDRLDINTNTYTSQDLKSALAKFKEGAETENSKDERVCNGLFCWFLPAENGFTWKPL